jgi:hypothetical protein
MANINEFILNNTDDETRTVECFTVLGQHEYLDDEKRPKIGNEDKALAKSVQVGSRPTRYYIKVGTYGKIFNPMGLYTEGHSEKFLAKIGRKQFEYKEVNQKIFDLYLNFLSTKNLAWLNNAERELS